MVHCNLNRNLECSISQKDFPDRGQSPEPSLTPLPLPIFQEFLRATKGNRKTVQAAFERDCCKIQGGSEFPEKVRYHTPCGSLCQKATSKDLLNMQTRLCKQISAFVTNLAGCHLRDQSLKEPSSHMNWGCDSDSVTVELTISPLRICSPFVRIEPLRSRNTSRHQAKSASVWSCSHLKLTTASQVLTPRPLPMCRLQCWWQPRARADGLNQTSSSFLA